MATQGKYSPPVPHGKGGRKEKRHHQGAGDAAAGVMHPPLPTRQEHEGYYVTMPLPNRPSLTHTISEPVPQPPPVPQVQLPDEEPSTPRHGPAIHFQPPTPDAPPLRPSPPLVLHHPMPSYPGSPPKLSWDPARSSPPKSKEYQMAQPFDKMYENVWDRGAEGGHGGYFEPPKYPDVPKEVRESYRAVMGDGNGGEKEGGQKQVWKPAFPWELEARPAPSRFFPESSEDDRPYRPPPVHHHGQQGQGHPASPPLMPSQWATWSQKTAHPVPTGLPTNLSYRNAWDEVNSIRKYAELLSRPKEASRRDERMRRGSSGAEDGGESGSGREGDDEDTDEERPPIHFKKGKEKRRSTSSSPIVSPTSPTRPGFGGARKHSIGSPNISPILRANRHAADLKGIPFPSNAPGTAPHGGNGNGTGTVGGSIPEGVPYNPRLSLPVGGSPRFTSITSPSGMPAPPSISPGIKPRLHRRFGSAGASPQISPTLAAVLTPKGPLMSPTATRVFDPKTDPTVIRRQGLKALEKFVRDMEASQAARSRASSSSTLSSSLSTDGTGSSLHPPGHGGGGTGDGNEGTSPKASPGLKPAAEGRISPLSRSPVIRATE
ncbi:hypothetical protein BT69DRAFT_1355864 [Atractiella rhizophila]|nr:hypothetical protein BT69DRAFT_1355864 [Atractiella rhizophila]